MNPLYQMMSMQSNPVVQRFMQFRNAFRGDAREQVQQLLNSGRVSQADYNRAVQLANQLQGLIGRN